MGVLDASRECRVRTGIAAVQILLDDLEHAFSCRDKTDDAHRVDFGLDTERRLGLTSREAIYQACPKRFQPIIMSTMAAMFGAVPLACGAPFARRRSATLRWHDGCQLFGPTARVRICEQRRHGRE
ncbi:MAG TPA: efflux RND transporter permease subunit [Casimicrobiaceae bacterium]|nr:efflux RND transporter permease subunit [Casimicrobiaceae bacterium]